MIDKIGAIIIALFVAAFIFTWGFALGKGNVQKDALRAKSAYYEVDPQTGKTTFKWITEKENK